MEYPKKIIVFGVQATATHDNYETKTKEVKCVGFDGMDASDGYHTFGELYDHRITLFIALCLELALDAGNHRNEKHKIWRSKRHSDGELCFGTGTQFVLGIGKASGAQITYHIPIERWDETNFAETLERAPEYDGHTSDDVLGRLKLL